MENAKIYLCKADSSILGTLTGIQTQTCNLKRNVTNLWELTFDVNRYIDADGELVQSDYYDSLDDMMRLYLDGADMQAFFVIDSEPVIKGDGYQETKSVTAHSIECELCSIYLKNFKINCGTTDSQEYLACNTDENGNLKYYNVNPYTGLPYNYITLINYKDTQLSLLHLVLQGTGWTVKEGIDEDICKIKKSFETSDSIYSFFMKTISPATSVIFEFDRKHKVVGLVKADDYGEDTGVFITMRNLMNSFEVTSTSNDSIVTKLIPTGANNLGIEQVNFGKDYILNLDYFMNTLNEYGDYKFVSKELHDKYGKWKHYRDDEQISICLNHGTNNCPNYKNGNCLNHESCNCPNLIQGTRREIYTELSRLYNKSISDISELHNRLPNDGCMIDYKTYKLDELKTAHTAYQNALAALITAYKNKYGVTEIDYMSEDLSPTPATATHIKDTPYWYDFYAYKEKIIPSIKEAFKMYCKTDSNGNLETDNGSFIELEFGNPDYYKDYNILKEADAYLYEWSLYGLDELEAKKKAWLEAANLLFDECFIIPKDSDSSDTSSIIYRTPDDNGWNGLSDEEKLKFTSQAAFCNKLKQYLDYMALDEEYLDCMTSDEEKYNSLTKTKCKGIIRQCEDAIAERMAEISDIEQRQNIYYNKRKNLADSVALDEHFKLTDEAENLFSIKDINIINGLMREQAFSNENILTTSLDNIVTAVNSQEELYQSAVEKLYEISQPQYSFKTELDNLYALDEFKAYQKPFDIGNFIRVGLEIHEEICDNHFIKLRLISISHNPLCTDENLSVEFSTMTRALNGISDLAFLLGSEISNGGTSSSSSSSGGTYGNNDANVQISNNMLNALLSTELFGTAVSDVILDTIKANKGNFNTLLSHSGVFDLLETGQLKVSGDCLFDGTIQSSNFVIPNNTISGSGSSFNLSNGTFESYASGNNYIKNDGKNLMIQMDNFSVDKNGNAKFSGYVDGGKININDRFSVDKEGNINIKNRNYITGNIGVSSFDFSKNPYCSYDFSTSVSKINIPLTTVYFYGYEDFDDDQEFSLFIDAQNIECTIWAAEIGNAEHITVPNAIYQYRFYKSDIKTGNSNIPDNLKHYIDINKIGYVTLGELELVTNDLKETVEQDYSEYSFISVRANTIESFSIHTSLPENANENCSWDTNYEPIKMLCIYYACSTDNVSISGYETQCISLNDYSPISMLFDPTSLEFGTTLTTKISTTGLKSSYIYNNVSVSGSELYISSDGTIGLSGSSKRFKNSISTTLSNVSDPHGLYDIDVVQYKYNDDYFSSQNDNGIGKYFIGFIAEDVAEKFKDGATFDNEGLVNGWSIRNMFPAALKLIQEQHNEIKTLKEQFEKLQQVIKEVSKNEYHKI